MVNTKHYVPQGSNYLKVDIVKSLRSEDRVAVVMEGGHFKDFKKNVNGVEKVDSKPQITVSVNGKIYFWSLSRTANAALGEEFGSFETENWVGSKIKLTLISVAGKETIGATLIQKRG